MGSQKKLVATRARILRRVIFGPPPLIAGEDNSQYDELVARVVAARVTTSSGKERSALRSP
jgi:hypothetical protein